MKAIQLKNYLKSIDDEANILIYVSKTSDTRPLRFFDIDRDHDGNIIIDAEYKTSNRNEVK